jgi:5'-phosphate synthase pdxT subunit
MRKVGVLALQGGYVEHIAALRRLGVQARPVRLPGELKGLGGLVIPGGESTTIEKLMAEYHLTEVLRKSIASGLPVLGTCAGMILLAKRVVGNDQGSLGTMDIDVRRNAFGRQVDSFEADLDVPALGALPFHAVFIRAPRIDKVGKGVEVLASLPDGTAVAARDGNLVATAFHPELTDDLRLHEYFLELVDVRLKPKTA